MSHLLVESTILGFWNSSETKSDYLPTFVNISNHKFQTMKTLLFTSAFIILGIFANAQKIYSVQYESQAEIKVFVVKYESQADLKVYKVKYESQARGNEGLWFFVKYESQADKKIYFVNYESQADLKIYFVEYESQAGWRNKSLMQLLYWKTDSSTSWELILDIPGKCNWK